MDRLLDGKRALVNVPGELLADGRLRGLSPETFGLEILETTKAENETLSSCRALKQAGYQLVLDDYTGQPELAEFLTLVDWVKVDYRVKPGPAPGGLGRKHPMLRPKLLAEKVETEREFEAAKRFGYDYFQGYFLERPSTVAGQKVRPADSAKLQIMKELASPELDLRQLEELIERDASLCVRLLRYANSARFNHTSPIAGVNHCLVQLGEIELRRWIALNILPELGAGRPKELLDSAVIRARMCERLADEAGLREVRSQAFLTGLFSLLAAVLRLPIEELAEELRFPEAMKQALVDRDCHVALGRLLAVAENYEKANWDVAEQAASSVGVPRHMVGEAYVDALNWAHEMKA
jgi:EAL and modified HD-GYP domain-containing signal transduction protein